MGYVPSPDLAFDTAEDGYRRRSCLAHAPPNISLRDLLNPLPELERWAQHPSYLRERSCEGLIRSRCSSLVDRREWARCNLCRLENSPCCHVGFRVQHSELYLLGDRS